MARASRRTLGSQAQHNTLWKTIHVLSNNAPPTTLNTTTTFNNKITTTPTLVANCFNQTIHKHCQTRNTQTNRYIDRATQNIQGYNITLTTTQVQEAIKQSKINKSQGPDKLNIRHIKHIDKGTSYRPISLLSAIANALEKSLLPGTKGRSLFDGGPCYEH